MPQSFDNELNKPVHDEDLYSEMYETLYGLQDDFDLYREKINEALMLITIMEQRQADFIKNYGRASADTQAAVRKNAQPAVQEARRARAPQPGYAGERRAAPTAIESGRMVQQKMDLYPDSGRYPAYKKEAYAPPRSSSSAAKPVVQCSTSVPVPEKFLFDDSAMDYPERGESHEAAPHRGKTEKKPPRSKKTKSGHGAKHVMDSDDKPKRQTKERVKEQEQPQNRKQKKIARAKDAIFYLVLVVIVSVVLVLSMSRGDGVRSLAGFSAFVVKSSSMEDVYPKNSLILTRRVAPEKLNIGDDITFFTNSTTTVTHRIIGVYEDYEQTGQRGFETKGTMNEKPDKDVVMAVNIVGRVVFCSALIGSLLLFVSKQWPLIIFFVIVITALVLVLKKILKS